MSYSRWSNSNWYSFWNTNSGETKESQVLSLWYCGADELRDYQYSELLEITPKLLKSEYDVEIKKSEIFEALRYIHQFIEDVDEQFDIPGYNEEIDED
jgi:hypothetical protein